MDTSTPVILKVEAPDYQKIVIEASDGKRYYSDLSSFSPVHCFPSSEGEWRSVSIEEGGHALIWACRFEVHVDQVIALANKIEDAFQSA